MSSIAESCPTGNRTDDGRDTLRTALSLPRPAFFCNGLKRPTCPNGFYDACQGDALEKLYRRHPGPLIGVPTGPASGFAVLDVDIAKGGDVWWSANKARLPLTRLHETRSGGLHVLFKHREGLRCSTSKIALGVDVRGELGYIVYWPAQGFSVVDLPIAPWPEWLRPPDPPAPEPARFTPLPADTISSRYGASALDRACSAISGAANGAQEATLNKESFSIGQLAGGGILERSAALAALLAVARSMPSHDPHRPWLPREVVEKVNRSFSQGESRPRRPQVRA